VAKTDCYAFIDTETTGTNFLEDRIIEISVLRIENAKLVKTFTTLLNPETPISPFVTQITGINQKDLEDAPTFFDIRHELLEILKGCNFVAHNVRFDYTFVKTEFKRLGLNFHSQTIDTIKLSRLLFPGYHRHNLDSIIERFNIECLHRHRAYDDAKVLVDFFKYLQENFPKSKLESAIKTLKKRPSLPPGLDPDVFEYLPETPGVYIFYDENNFPIYIGKSINLKERVLSHFHQSSASPSELSLVHQIKNIKTIDCAGDLSASILESQLIKSLKPLHNRLLRQNKKTVILKRVTTPENYYAVSIEETDRIPIKDLPLILATFKNKRQAKTYLDHIAKEYNLCAKLLGLEKTDGPCFLYHIDICLGACIQKELYLKYNLRFLEAFSHKKFQRWPFDHPVVITESNHMNGLTEKMVFDNWCFLGKVRSDDYHDSETSLVDVPEFDLDIYRILKRFLNKEKNYSKVTKFSRSDLNNLKLKY
jgi:DNA polymerase-3 subunit epsilon